MGTVVGRGAHSFMPQADTHSHELLTGLPATESPRLPLVCSTWPVLTTQLVPCQSHGRERDTCTKFPTPLNAGMSPGPCLHRPLPLPAHPFLQLLTGAVQSLHRGFSRASRFPQNASPPPWQLRDIYLSALRMRYHLTGNIVLVTMKIYVLAVFKSWMWKSPVGSLEK